jgi:hypothetical protein
MHAEHRQWLSDDAMWRDDLAAWEGEVNEALEGLKMLGEALRKHGEALRSHLATIGREEEVANYHEKAIADYEAGGSGVPLLHTAQIHQQTGARHVHKRLAHERLKRHHHTVMAHWNLLFKALTHKA